MDFTLCVFVYLSDFCETTSQESSTEWSTAGVGDPAVELSGARLLSSAEDFGDGGAAGTTWDRQRLVEFLGNRLLFYVWGELFFVFSSWTSEVEWWRLFWGLVQSVENKHFWTFGSLMRPNSHRLSANVLGYNSFVLFCGHLASRKGKYKHCLGATTSYLKMTWFIPSWDFRRRGSSLRCLGISVELGCPRGVRCAASPKIFPWHLGG